MLQIPGGQFFGNTTVTTRLHGLTLTDTEYVHDRVDWHFHEKPYFTFLIAGTLVEGTRKATHHCEAGALLFHNWQEPHFNIKPKGSSRGFHVELDPEWLEGHDVDLTELEGDMRLHEPDVKLIFQKIFLETKQAGEEQRLSIPSLLLEGLALMHSGNDRHRHDRPAWLRIVRDRLHDMQGEIPSLTELAHLADVHPVHLSRTFPRYFGNTLGAYVRKVKVDRALSLMSDRKRTLTDIAHLSGFADQSHFIRCFQDVMGLSPSTYRNRMFKGQAG